MRIFVTGGTGFIGSHFIKLALAEGHEVIAIKRSSAVPKHGSAPNLTWLDSSLDTVPQAALKGCQSLVHFAAEGVSPQQTNWEKAFEVNVFKSISLFSTAVDAGIPHLITCGSCLEYGKSGERYAAIPADAPLEPVGPYAASKAAFSLAVAAMARTTSSSFTILRPFHLYGEGQHPSNFWPALRNAAISGKDFSMTLGEQLRDYMPVENAAAVFLDHAVRPPSAPLSVANVASGHCVELRDFAKEWWKKWNAVGNLIIGALPYREGEVMRFIPKL